MERRTTAPLTIRIVLALWIWCLLLPAIAMAQDEPPIDETTDAELIDDRRVGASVSILDFEEFGIWQRGQEAWGTFTHSDEEFTQGSFSGQLAYDFPAVSNNYIIFQQIAAIPGRPDGLQIQVYGDGSTHFLNAWIEDATGQIWQFTFGRIDHLGWQPMFAPLDLSVGWPNQSIFTQNDGDIVFPIALAGLVLDGHSSEQASQGVVYVDDLRAITFADSPNFAEELLDEAEAEDERSIAASRATATIVVERLNVREGPAVQFPVVTTVNENETLPIVAEDTVNGWYQVRTADGEGWVSEAFVTVELSSEDVNSADVNSDDVNSADVNSADVNSADVNSADVNSDDVNSDEFNAAVFVIDGPSITETVPISPSAISPLVAVTATLPPTITATSAITDTTAENSSSAQTTSTITNSVAPSLTGRIAFPSYAAGSYSIFTINADGTDLKWVAGDASQPALSPDGTRIAFRNWQDDARGLAVVEAGGGSIRQITNTAEDALPAWAPDDDTLVFFSRREGDRRARIHQASVFNRNEWQLEEIGGEYPNWTPDGRLLYRATRPQIAIAMMDDDGQNQLSLIADGQATAPTISPDGETILYMSRRDGNWEIYRTDIDGGEPVRLTDNPANDGLPVFSPDGSQVAFVTDRDDFWALWLMNIDGSNQRQLLAIPGDLDARMPDEPLYRFRGWQEERISWGP